MGGLTLNRLWLCQTTTAKRIARIVPGTCTNGSMIDYATFGRIATGTGTRINALLPYAGHVRRTLGADGAFGSTVGGAPIYSGKQEQDGTP